VTGAGSNLGLTRSATPSPVSGVSAPRILVVDEEAGIGRGLQIMVRSAGYTVEVAGTRLDVLARVIAIPPDAMLLDLVRADGRAVELCGEVRRSSELPILVLSAVGDAHERTRALEAGADDFVIRPFGVDELLARLRAVLRQPAELEGSTRLEIGELVIDVTERRVSRGDEDVPLTPLEFELLCELARYHGRPVTDRHLLRTLSAPECIDATRALRVLVAGIRGKLEREPSRPEYLITEPGAGYRLTRSP
jgi:two-component system KDP operon response regulator KdpE